MIQFSLHLRRLIATLVCAAFALGLLFAWKAASGELEKSERKCTFQIRSEFHLGDQNGQRLLHEMARLQQDVESTLGLQGFGRPIEVTLFYSRESYLKYLQGKIPEAANRSAMFIDGRFAGRIYVYHHPDFERDLRHECTHAVLHLSLQNIPLWLDEGLAEYFEILPDERAHGNSYLSELREQIEAGWVPDLVRLETLQSVSDLNADDYRECWAWAHFLLHGPEAAQTVLKNVIRRARAGDPVGRLSDQLRACLPDMDVQLMHHLKTW